MADEFIITIECSYTGKKQVYHGLDAAVAAVNSLAEYFKSKKNAKPILDEFGLIEEPIAQKRKCPTTQPQDSYGDHSEYSPEEDESTDDEEADSDDESSEKKGRYSCDHCDDYSTDKKCNLKYHCLSKHALKDERQKQFTYYCALCDVGSFSQICHTNHLNAQNHREKASKFCGKFVTTQNKIILKEGVKIK